jgi:cell division septum initiation protein DivIVA
MGMVAPQQRIASAYVVIFGQHGGVSQYARERGVCRQWVYREAAWVQERLAADREENQHLRQQVRELTKQKAALEELLAKAVVIDEEKQTEVASVAQAIGVSLPACWQILDVLIPDQQLSVPSLGRRTQAAGQKAGALLAVLDEYTRPQVRDVLADEIHVKAPVLMTVEPESLCWLGGRCTDTVSGDAWAEELERFPNLEQVTRDGGKGIATGVALVSERRQAQGQAAVGDQGDHFHALHTRGAGLHWAAVRAGQALTKAEKAQRVLDECERQGQPRGPVAAAARAAWKKAEQAMDRWSELERCWNKTKEALRLFTPEGELNTREKATAVLAETLPRLPDQGFAKSKRALQRPEMLQFLDRVQQKLEALPFAPEVQEAAVRQEGLRRRPELLRGDNAKAAAMRGVLLMCSVVLSKAGAAGQQAVAAVRDICRRAYRASSLVECVNSVLRMQQSRHRRMSQGLIDLKRLYWNCHTFRTGRRKHTTPYQRLGVPWPPGFRWWDLLKLTPEQLRDKLSTTKTAE